MSEEQHTNDYTYDESKSSRTAVLFAVVTFILLCCLCLLASGYILLNESTEQESEVNLTELLPIVGAGATETAANIVSFGSEVTSTPPPETASSNNEPISSADKAAEMEAPPAKMPAETTTEISSIVKDVPGSSRANPHPPEELVNAANWDIMIEDVVRGNEAWEQIMTSDPFFASPAPDGMAYLLVGISAVSTYNDDDPHTIGSADFGITGSSLKHYRAHHILDYEAMLDAELLTGEEAEGWLAFIIDERENDLILVFDELWNFENDRPVYIAVDEGASIAVDPEMFEQNTEEQNPSKTSPVPAGETAVTGGWKVAVLDIVKGDAAWALVQDANQFNEPPADGMEYLALYLSVSNVGKSDLASYIGSSLFQTTGGRNIEYDAPFILGPQPQMDVWLYPGGQHEGWLIVQAGEGEGGLVLKFDPIFAGQPVLFSLE